MVAVKAADVDRAVQARRAEIVLLLFYGPDAGRVSERARAAAAAAASDPGDPFSLVRIDGDLLAEQPARLIEEATTFSMFGGRRAVWVRPTSRNIAGAVSACLEAAPTDTLVVVESGDLAKGAPLRALCEASPRALALPSYADDARDLGRVVDEMLRETGMRIDARARELLVHSLGGDRLATRGEVEKLALYAAGQDEITIEDVEAIVSDVSAAAVDAALDAAFSGNGPRLDDALAHLDARAVAPAQILALALRHAQQLMAAVASRVDSGGDEDALRAWRGLNFRRKETVLHQVRTWTAPQLMDALARLQACMLDTRRMPNLAETLVGRTLMGLADGIRRRSRGG